MWYFELICEDSARSPLPMDTAARMARARQLGFDVSRPLFHGTGAGFDRFKKRFGGTAADIGKGHAFAIWLSSSSAVAGSYAERASSDQTAWDGSIMPRSGQPNIMPVYLRPAGFMTVNCADFNHYQLLRHKSHYLSTAQSYGDAGVIFRNAEDGSAHRSDVYAVFNPNRLRSIFARFDPARARSTNLLA